MLMNTTADIVLTSNAIFTGITDEPIKGAIAVKGNVIHKVGTMEEINPLIGKETKVYHFEDQLIMPGFIDSHIHLFMGSLWLDSLSLYDAKSEEEAAKMVKEFAERRKDEPWLFGFEWSHLAWENKKLPHRETLDKYIPDRPVFLFNRPLHGAWVNSKALEIMGIDETTPDPPFGKIERDDDGKPTGFLYETAMGFAQDAFNSIPIEKQKRMLRKFLAYSAKYGVTSVSDMFPLPALNLGNLELYREFEQQNKLTTRIHFLIELTNNFDLAKELKSKYQSNRLRFSGLKQFLDGVPSTYTAYLVEPYSDKPETRGSTLISPDEIKELVLQADKEDFRVRLHACGDGSVRLGLDCFAHARKLNGENDLRHTIEHNELVHPDDLHRFSELNVIASFQPEHLSSNKFSESPLPIRFGKEREKYIFPIKTLSKLNTKIIFGTDFPVVDLNPMLQIYRAITRVHHDGKPNGGWIPEEKITIAEALRHYTIDAAYNIYRENELGTLEAGKLADITVIDKNLFEIPEEEILHAKPIMTMIDGEIIYEKSEQKQLARMDSSYYRRK